MQEVVDAMVRDEQYRINNTINRYTNSRLISSLREAKKDFFPIDNAKYDVLIAYNLVSNAQFAEFIKQTGYNPSSGLTYDNSDYPVVNVSYVDALIYCNWLSKNDSNFSYRLPTEKEWKSAKKYVSKNTNLKNEKTDELVPVNDSSKKVTKKNKENQSDMWEWTSTSKDPLSRTVKSLCSSKSLKCKIKNRHEFKNSSVGYNNVGFRVVREK